MSAPEFDKLIPVQGTTGDAPPIKDNFNALAQHHRGATAPADPDLGWIFLDTADDDNWKLKQYTQDGANPAAWVVLLEHVESNPTGAAQQNVLYVGKHGDDSGDGKSIEHAFLTFGAAITAASGQTPSSANLFTIVCMDAGIYAEAVTMAQFVSIYAPSATITDSVLLADDVYLVVDRVSTTGDFSPAIYKNTAGITHVRARALETAGTGSSPSVVNITNGTLYLEADRLTAAPDASAIAFVSGNAIFVHLNVKKIEVTNGAGVTVISFGPTVEVRGHIGEIAISGVGKGLDGNGYILADLDCDKVSDSGSGSGIFLQNAGTTTLRIGDLNCATAYSVGSGVSLYLIANKISGTRTINAAAFARITESRRDNVTATTDPTVNDDEDDGYAQGSHWQNNTTKHLHMLVDATAGAAVWQDIGKDVNQSQIFYVGKHGDDTADGRTPDKAKLTFGSAITAASGETPTASNRFVIVCEDAGIYDETITMVEYVSLHAPAATITASSTAGIILTDNVSVVIDRISVTGTITIGLRQSSGTARVKVGTIETDGSGSNSKCVVTVGGTLYLEADLLTTANVGVCLAVSSTTAYVNIKKCVSSGSNSLVTATSSCNIFGFIGALEAGLLGECINVTGGNIDLTCDRLVDGGAGTGYYGNTTGTAILRVGEISAATAIELLAGATLYLIADKITGTRTINAAAFVRITEARRDNTSAATDPTVNDDIDLGYTTQSRWTNTTTGKEMVCVDPTSGAAVWMSATALPAFDYLVGPVGKGRFQTIQAAVDQAASDGGWTVANQAHIGIFEGNYAEDVALFPWVILEAVTYFENQAINTDEIGERVEIQGTVSFDVTSGSNSDITLIGLKIIPASGAALAITGGDYGKRISLHDCTLEGASDEDTITATSNNTYATIITLFRCLLECDDGQVIMEPTKNHRLVGNQSVFTSQSFTTGQVVIRSDGGWVILYGKEAIGSSSGNVYGSIEVKAGSTGNILILNGVWFWRGSTLTANVTVDGTLTLTYSHFMNCYDVPYPALLPAAPIIDGTNAATFQETPAGDAGDIHQYDGSQWQNVQLAAESADYLVGPAGTAKYTSIQTAIDQAVTDGHGFGDEATIFILDGTYTEDLTLKPYIHLSAVKRVNLHTPPDVIIIGSHTWSSASANMVMTGLYFQSSAAASMFTFSGTTGNSTLFFTQCYINHTGSGESVIEFGTGIPEFTTFESCWCTVSGASFHKGGAFVAMDFRNTELNRGVDTGDLFDMTGGFLNIQGDRTVNTEVKNRIHVVSGTPVVTIRDCVMDKAGSAANVQVDIALLSTSYFFNCVDEDGGPITIAGAQASTFKEYPHSAVAGDIYQYDGNQWQIVEQPKTITWSLFNDGAVLNTGEYPELIEVPFDCTIESAAVLSDVSGSIVIDIWKTDYSDYEPGVHPVVGDTIVASAKPTLSSAYKSEDSTLTGWTVALLKGDLLKINVDSVSTIKWARLALRVTVR